MADLNKIVEYKIVGDNTSLIKTVTSAINKLDALDNKLNKISRAKDLSVVSEDKARNAVARIGSITEAISKLAAIRNILNTVNVDLLTPSQLALIKTASSEITNLKKILTSAGTSGRVTQEQLDVVNNTIKNLSKSFKAAGITVVDYAAIEKQKAKEAAKAEKEKARSTKESLKEEKRLLKERADDAKEAQRILDEEAAAYKRTIKDIINTVSSIVSVLRRVWNVSYKLMQFAADFGETMNKFNVITGDSAQTLSEFADSMINAFGLDAQEIYENVASFKSIASSINLANKQGDLFTKTLSQLSVDLSSLYNTSIEQSMNALISGLHGLQKPLKAYNIYVYDANLEQTRLTYGITKQVSAMNEAEKTLLRYLTILDQSKVAQGDMAKTLGSAANQIRILQAQFNMLKRSLGQIVTAIGLTVVPALNLLLGGLSKLFTTIAKSLGYEIENFANIFDSSNSSIDDGTEAINNYVNAANKLSGLDEINLVSQTDSTVIDPDTGNLKIDDKLLDAIKGYDNLMDKITNQIGDTADKVAQGLEGTLTSGVFQIFVNALKAIGDAFKFVIDNWQGFEPAFKTLIDLLTIFIGIKVAQTLKSWGIAITSVASKMSKWSKQLPLFNKNIRGEIELTQTSVNGLTVALSAVTFAAMNAIASSFYNQFEGETKRLVATIGLIVSALTGLAIAWMAAHGAMSWGTAIPVITGAIGVGVASIQAMIPQMATGGVVDQPTVAMIGEGRYDEAVVPLGNSPQFRAMKEDISAGVARKLSQTPTYPSDQLRARSGNTPVVLQIDGRELARALLPYLGYTQAQTGVKFR